MFYEEIKEHTVLMILEYLHTWTFPITKNRLLNVENSVTIKIRLRNVISFLLPSIIPYLVTCQSLIYFSLVAQMVRNLPSVWETWVQSLFWEDHLEKGMATHSSILGKIPWRRERQPTPVFWPREFHGLQSIGLQRVGHNLVIFTSLHFSLLIVILLIPLQILLC